MKTIERYKLRRYSRIMKRAYGIAHRFDSDDEKGRWITTENNHKVHLNEEGEPDKGNPHVIVSLEVDKFKETLNNKDVLSAFWALPQGFVFSVGDYKFIKDDKSGYLSYPEGEPRYGFQIGDLWDIYHGCKFYGNKNNLLDEPISVGESDVLRSEKVNENERTEEPKEEPPKESFSIKHPDESFSNERKNKALWDKSGGYEADKLLRPLTEKVWKSSGSKTKDSLFQYTTDKDYGYQDINLMMREGAPDWWTEHDKGIVQNNINNITKAIDKSGAPRDIWLQRGCSAESLGKLFNVSKEQYKNFSTMTPEDIMDTISSAANYGQDKAFMSCGSGKNKGTLSEVILNIYCPKGTKMLYAEPFSKWGNGGKRDWDGRKKQSKYSDEDETILQRGTMVVPRKVTKANGRIYVDVDVIGQEY